MYTQHTTEDQLIMTCLRVLVIVFLQTFLIHSPRQVKIVCPKYDEREKKMEENRKFVTNDFCKTGLGYVRQNEILYDCNVKRVWLSV